MKDFFVYYESGALIQQLNQLAQSGNYVFRGYTKQDELIPSLIRGSDYSNLELEFLEEFEKYGSPYFHATTPIDFMSYAQHFGIPTRLLDFTFNPFIALSFALYNGKANNYSNPDDQNYYYIRVADLNQNCLIDKFTFERASVLGSSVQFDTLSDKATAIIKCINDNQYGALRIKEFEDRKTFEGKILFVDPNKSNQRIMMQQGLFMFPYTLIREQHLRILEGNSSVIKIEKHLRNELLSYLDTLGFNTYRLMPDLPSVCGAITKRVKERNKKSKVKKTIVIGG